MTVRSWRRGPSRQFSTTCDTALLSGRSISERLQDRLVEHAECDPPVEGRKNVVEDHKTARRIHRTGKRNALLLPSVSGGETRRLSTGSSAVQHGGKRTQTWTDPSLPHGSRLPVASCPGLPRARTHRWSRCIGPCQIPRQRGCSHGSMCLHASGVSDDAVDEQESK